MSNTKENTSLVDTFGRVHDYLRISLSERCNLRCFYCMPEEGVALSEKPEIMNSEELLEIASTFVKLGIKKIRLTGGEPLVRKNADKIMEGLAKLPIELAITTNGILLDRYIDVFKRINLKNINVSLDSLDEAKQIFITKRNYYHRIMENIDLLFQNGFKVKVNVVVMKGVNDNEIIDFIEKSKDWNAEIRFIEFMPFDGNKWNKDKCVPYDDLLEKVYSHYGKENILPIERKVHQTSQNYQVKGYSGNFGLINTVSKPFCGDCNRLRLTANGKMKNCLFSQGESDILSALREGKDIVPMIVKNVQDKKEMRGGMKTQEEFYSPLKNRSMILIGG